MPEIKEELENQNNQLSDEEKEILLIKIKSIIDEHLFGIDNPKCFPLFVKNETAYSLMIAIDASDEDKYYEIKVRLNPVLKAIQTRIKLDLKFDLESVYFR